MYLFSIKLQLRYVQFFSNSVRSIDHCNNTRRVFSSRQQYTIQAVKSVLSGQTRLSSRDERETVDVSPERIISAGRKYY